MARLSRPDSIEQPTAAVAEGHPELTGKGCACSFSLPHEGGSIGSVVTMQKHLRAPITFLGLSLPEHGYHAKNENYDWGQTSGGIKMFVKYFEEIAKLK